MSGIFGNGVLTSEPQIIFAEVEFSLGYICEFHPFVDVEIMPPIEDYLIEFVSYGMTFESIKLLRFCVTL